MRLALQCPEAIWTVTLRGEDWDALHAGAMAPELLEALLANKHTQRIKVLVLNSLSGEVGVKLTASRSCLRALLAYLQTVAFLHGGRLVFPEMVQKRNAPSGADALGPLGPRPE